MKSLRLYLFLILSATGAALAFFYMRQPESFRHHFLSEAHDRLEELVVFTENYTEGHNPLSGILDKTFGKCEAVALPKADATSSSLTPLLDVKIHFAQPLHLNVRANCEVPAKSPAVLFQPQPKTTFTLRRQWEKPIITELSQGSLQVQSDSLQLIYRLPAMDIRFSSQGSPTKLTLERTNDTLVVVVAEGKIEVAPQRLLDFRQLTMPMEIRTGKGAEVSNDGKIVLASEQSAMLLPSGFQPATSAPVVEEKAPAPPIPPQKP